MMSTNTEFNLADRYTRNLGLHNLGKKKYINASSISLLSFLGVNSLCIFLFFDACVMELHLEPVRGPCGAP